LRYSSCLALSYGVEYGLHIGLRPADDSQYLACRRLLLQRLGDLRMGFREGAILFLKLLKQTDVLDRNDGLLGEGLEELDLTLSEWSRRFPRYRDRADGLAITGHRHAQHASQPGRPDYIEENRSPWGGPSRRGAREDLGDGFRSTRSGIVLGGEVHHLAVVADDDRVFASAQSAGIHHNGVKHRLHISRGARDDSQDLARRRPLIERRRQALLKVVNPGALALPRLASDKAA
jgi:hypothetical protein